MEKFELPEYIKSEINITITDQQKVEEAIQQATQHLQQLITKRSELNGKVQGILSIAGGMAEFDLEKPIQLSEDRNFLEGTRRD